MSHFKVQVTDFTRLPKHSVIISVGSDFEYVVFHQSLQNLVDLPKTLGSRNIKLKVSKTLIRLTLSYGSQTWTMIKRDTNGSECLKGKL